MKHPYSVNFLGLSLLACLTAVSVQAAQVFSPGFLKLQTYTTNDVVDASYFSDLDTLKGSNPNYPDTPDKVQYVTQFEVQHRKYKPGNMGGQPVGQRLTGFIVPDQTTNYVFYLSASSFGELWLSIDEDPLNAMLIATSTSGQQERTYDTNFPSVAIPLEAGKRYYVEALECNSGGSGVDELAVTWAKEGEPPPAAGTPPIPGRLLGIYTDADSNPPGAITNLAVVSTETSYVKLSWTAPGDDGNTAQAAAAYALRYSAVPITEANWSSAILVATPFLFPAPAGSNESLKVANLSPDTVYNFAMRAMDEAGNLGPLSNVASARTKVVPSAGEMEPIWELTFDQPGQDPTANGDWVNRGGAINWAEAITGGILKAGNFNPVLDTRPLNDFTEPFIVEFRARSLTPLPEDAGVYEGAMFWVNLDTADGQHAAVSVSLQLVEDGTQKLKLVNNGNMITNFPGLSTNFQTVRAEFEPALNLVRIKLNGEDRGSFTYELKPRNDDRYVTVTSWGGEAEFDYVRIGQPPVKPMVVKWDLAFDVAGQDPTANGDWVNRGGAINWAEAITGGILKAGNFNPVLDTRPLNDFTEPFIVEFRARSLTPLPESVVVDGAMVFVNLDTADGQQAAVAVSLQLMEDGTQRLKLVNNGIMITNFPGLSTNFHTVRVEFEPAINKMQVDVDGSDTGWYEYTLQNANDDRYATVTSWGGEAEFDFVRIGQPVPTQLPQSRPTLTIGRTGNNIQISWPTSATGFTLESTPSLSPTSWGKVADPTVQGDLNVVSTTVDGTTRFYRLRQ